MARSTLPELSSSVLGVFLGGAAVVVLLMGFVGRSAWAVGAGVVLALVALVLWLVARRVD